MAKNNQSSNQELIEVGDSLIEGITLSKVFQGHTDSINQIIWSADGKFLASASSDKTIRIWEFEKGQHIEALNIQANSISWSPEIAMLACATDSMILIWNI